jgi:hypothetical protein
VKISTGAAEDHPTPLPIDSTATPGVAAPTPRFPSGNLQGGVRDLAAERLDLLSASEAECAAAQTAGMSADSDRRGRYAASAGHHGASAGDQIALPEVPGNVVPAAESFGYPFSGMQPTPAGAGWEYSAEPGG